MYRLTAVVILLLVAAFPAQARELSAEDLARAVNFSQRMQSVYHEGMALSVELDSAENYIDSYFAGEIEQAEFTAALDPYLEDMAAAVADFRKRYPRAPSPPSIGSPKHERSLAGFAEMVVGLGGQLDRQLQIVHQLRDAALAGDDAAYDIASADSIALAGEMILAENASLEGNLVALKSSHPQHGLVHAIIGGNEAMVVALQVIEANLRGEGFDAGEYALGVEESLRKAGRAIVDGEKAAARMLQGLEGKFATSDSDRYGAEFIGDLVEAYGRAFAIERNILESERGLLDYLRAVNAGDEDPDSSLAAMEEFQSALAEHAEQRLEEQNVRLQMAADFASRMKTLQN